MELYIFFLVHLSMQFSILYEKGIELLVSEN